MFLTALAAMLASCSSSESELLGDSPGSGKVEVPSDGKYPVGFNAYANRSVTRAGQTGILDINGLQATQANGGGFGVFAYYTDLKRYDQTYIPNFMYNQGVFYDTGRWEYTPLMYWPNESGSDAMSDDEDKLTFFAYAPYVHHASAGSGNVEGEDTWGITGFSTNSKAGDPLVKYIAGFTPLRSVDLCWGVCDETSWSKFQSGNDYTQTMQKGYPWLNVEHPHGIDQKLKFTFKHALAQLNVQIDADADGVTHAEGSDIDSNTRIYVRSISFTGIAMKGSLNLNNTVGGNRPEALWLDYSGLTDIPYGQAVTIMDGRRDGGEGKMGALATNETPTGLNSRIIQGDTPTQGVTHTAVNLFEATSLNSSVCVIPTGEQMTVTIVYDVETANPSLSGILSDGVTQGISVENKITKTVNFGAGNQGLKSGNKYTLKLHLGMNSVKFDAAVSDWADGEDVQSDAWLPGNLAANAPVTMSLGTSQTIPLTSGSRTLTVTTIPAGDPITDLNNSVPSVASVTPVTSSGTRGNVEVPSGCQTFIIKPLSVGTTVITATTAHGTSQTTVVVTDENTTETKVSFDADEMALYAGETGGVTATTNPTGQPVTWVSSNGKVATVDQTTGQITALESGVAIITATTASGNTASLNLAVKPTEVRLSQTTGQVIMSEDLQLTATTVPDGKAVTWTSNNTAVATVNATSGLVHGVAPGTATITATIAGGGTATCFVTVIPSVAQVTAAPTPVTVNYNGSEQNLLSGLGSCQYGTLKYSVTTTETQPEEGSFTEGMPKATNAGTYYVWYFVDGRDGFQDSEVSHVTSKINKRKDTISFGTASYDKVTGDDSFAQAVTNTGDGAVSYSISNAGGSGATINATTGEVTIGATAGTATVTATVTDGTNSEYDTKTASYTITITTTAVKVDEDSNVGVDNWGTEGTGTVTVSEGGDSNL